jgi:hydroxymethylpyrimidine pyrophosphatase-like HAD family hydrolase
MRFGALWPVFSRARALAIDYDGTLAEGGHVPPVAVAALRRARARGKRLILLAGRELDDLVDRFPDVDLFDVVVAEHGAILYTPAPPRERALGAPPPLELVHALECRAVPVSRGRIALATTTSHEGAVRDTLEELDLGLQVAVDREALFAMPDGVDIAGGLRAALVDLDLDAREVVAIGDGESDHGIFRLCGAGIAVANAMTSLRLRADFVTRSAGPRGVAEGIDELLRWSVRARRACRAGTCGEPQGRRGAGARRTRA